MANYYTWTDDPIVANVNKPKAVYYTELKANMEKIRAYIKDFVEASSGTTMHGAYLGKNTASYSMNPTPATNVIVQGGTTNDLRSALDDVNSAWTSYHGAWSWCQQYSNNGSATMNARLPVSPSLSSVRIRAIHVNELRDQLDLVDASLLSNIPFCGTACQVSCQNVCQAACQFACQGCNNGTCHDQMCGAW